MQYCAAIGKSSYEIPYSIDEDLPLLKELCSKVNGAVNTVISSNKSVTNEQALLLALINVFYEIHVGFDGASSKNVHDRAYTKNDVLDIISIMHRAISAQQ